MTFYPSDILFAATALAYVWASCLFLAQIAGSTRLGHAEVWGPRLVAAGAALHCAHIVVSSLVFNVCPVRGVHFPLSVFSMLACVAYLALRVRYRIGAVGALVTPMALTFLLASRFVGMGSMGAEPSAHVQSAMLPLHVAANLLGDALFLLAFAAAALYLAQERRLKQKKLEGLFQRLPPLDALERAEHRFLLIGFPFLTVGILTGTLWARRVEAGSSVDVWRAAFGYISWLVFAGVLILRTTAGWRGRRAAYGTIVGFGFAVVVLLIYLFRGAMVSGAAGVQS